MVVVVSGSGTTRVVVLEGMVVLIVGLGAGETISGRLEGTVVNVGKFSGAEVLVVVFGTGAG